VRDLFVDVNCEFDTLVLARQRDPTRFALELSREEADRMCATSGARLRTDRPPQVVIRTALKPETGRDVTLVATRWAIVAPDSVFPKEVATPRRGDSGGITKPRARRPL
jgi:hypothetical protein